MARAGGTAPPNWQACGCRTFPIPCTSQTKPGNPSMILPIRYERVVQTPLRLPPSGCQQIETFLLSWCSYYSFLEWPGVVQIVSEICLTTKHAAHNVSECIKACNQNVQPVKRTTCSLYNTSVDMMLINHMTAYTIYDIRYDRLWHPQTFQRRDYRLQVAL